MKTVIVWDMCGQENVRFAVLDGDFTHLSGVYINDADVDTDKENELSSIFYDEEGQDKQELREQFPVEVVKSEECAVITAGFYP